MHLRLIVSSLVLVLLDREVVEYSIMPASPPPSHSPDSIVALWRCNISTTTTPATSSALLPSFHHEHKPRGVSALLRELRPFSKSDLTHVLRYLDDNEYFYELRGQANLHKVFDPLTTTACANSLNGGGEVGARSVYGLGGEGDDEEQVGPQTGLVSYCFMEECTHNRDQQVPTGLLRFFVAHWYVQWTAGASLADLPGLLEGPRKTKARKKLAGGNDRKIKKPPANPSHIIVPLSDQAFDRFNVLQPASDVLSMLLYMLDRVCEWQRTEITPEMLPAGASVASKLIPRLVSEAEFESAQILAANVLKSSGLFPAQLPATLRIDDGRGLFLYIHDHRTRKSTKAVGQDGGGGRVAVLPVYFDPRDPVNIYYLYPAPDPELYKRTAEVPCFVPDRDRIPTEPQAMIEPIGEAGARLRLPYNPTSPHACDLEVCEGASLLISVLNPRVELQINPHLTALLQHWISAPTLSDEQRFREAAEQGRRVVMVRKCWGLAHETHPFCVDKDSIFVDGSEMLDRMFAVSHMLNLGLTPRAHDFQHVSVPFTFPPAVDSFDGELQREVGTMNL